MDTQIEFVAGDTVPFCLGIAADEHGDPVSSLEGWRIWFSVAPAWAPAGGALLLAYNNFKFSPEITTLDNYALWQIPASASESLLLAGERYSFDVQVRSPRGTVATLKKGLLFPQAEVTRGS